MFKTIKSALILSAFIATSVFSGEMVTITTAKGEVSVPKNPAKVAVFDLGVLDNLRILGIDDNIATISTLFNIPQLEQTYSDNPKVGTIFQPDLEKLIAYQPDLIIIAARSKQHLEVLQKIAPTVDMTLGDNFIKSSKQSFNNLGKIFSVEDKATEILATLDKKLSKVQSLPKGKAMFVMVNGNKLATYGSQPGKRSRFGWIFTQLGFEPANNVTKVTKHGDPISFEFIKETNPEWMMVFDRASAIGKVKSGESAKEVLNTPLVTSTKAWRNNNMIYLEPMVYLGIGSIKSIQNTADMVIKKLQQ